VIYSDSDRSGGAELIYLKCSLAGLAAVLVIFGILPILAILTILLMGIGVDLPQWHFASPVFWVAAVGVFGVGFFWELHRLTK
jgi:hypothetical protein